ncbi:MAG: hypothetical protein GF416_05225 [Candidatus Altiarchaeales archaeon]|nr:hypothetical protein [Candidatus Altiarchaeales archaeon]MBD3416518.1 hypothetical protein [Candidatus Altiarchaeales archaeon]
MKVESLLKKSLWHVAAAAFTVSLGLRLVIGYVFQSHFGWHSVNHLETWLYTGVMEGTHLTGYQLLDPTVWLLRIIGMAVPDGLSLYAVMFTAVVLASLTAALITVFIGMLYDKRTGFVAGLIYGGMIEPLALSLSGFTHDHMQLPIVVVTFIIALKAVRSTGRERRAWGLGYLVLVFIARYVNEIVYVGAGATALYIFYEAFRPWVEDRYGRKTGSKVYPAMIGLLVLSLVFFTNVVPLITDYLVGKMEALPQGWGGSADVMPLSLITFWLRYNILLFLLPAGLAAGYKRRDTYGISLMLFGFVIATVMDRGTRVSDVGVAILSAYAIVDWNLKPRRKPGFVKSLPEFMRRRYMWWLTSLYSVGLFAFMSSWTVLRTEYFMIYTAGGATILYSLYTLKKDKLLVYAVSTVLLVGLMANTAYVYNVEPRRIVTETEYQVLHWLGENNRGGKVLAGWDRGYMVEAVSGLEAVSTPHRIDEDVHEMLWFIDRHAAVSLRKEGVRYVLLNSENFNVIGDGVDMAYRLTGGLLMEPDKVPPMELTNRFTIYKLRTKTADRHFKLLKEEHDPVTGMDFLLYEITEEPTEEEMTNSMVSAVAANIGSDKIALIDVELIRPNGKVYKSTTNDTFEAGEVREVMYTGRKNFREYDCRLSARPIKGELWGYVGELTFVNKAEARYVEIRALLVERQSDTESGIFTKVVHFKEGQKKTIQYSFENVDPDREYMLRLDPRDGLEVIEDESTPPTVEAVIFLATFC